LFVFLTAKSQGRKGFNLLFFPKNHYFGCLAPIAAASFCGGVRHKKYSGKREPKWAENT